MLQVEHVEGCRVRLECSIQSLKWWTSSFYVSLTEVDHTVLSDLIYSK